MLEQCGSSFVQGWEDKSLLSPASGRRLSQIKGSTFGMSQAKGTEGGRGKTFGGVRANVMV